MKNKALRRFRMGLATLLGRPEGFFTPYRYAATVRRPQRYPELEAVFHAAEGRMEAVLAGIEAALPELAALSGPPPVPRWDQSWFPRLDGLAAWVLAQEAGRIIEVGSGHSTRMLVHAAPGARTTCIDPQPRADISGLGVEVVPRVLAPADIERFRTLGPGDVAFFDSSHVLWEGSDVDMILARILPVLAPGVLVHVHDVTLPDPYPEAWAWRGYTEQLGLAGYLTSPAWEVLWSSHYAATRLGAAERVSDVPIVDGARETSLWLRRV